ncbi:MAG: hypothetical protein V4529_16665 [Gemmatimonadota bacterium]
MVDVDEGAAAQGLKSGAFAFAKGQAVPVISPKGDVGTVPAEQAADALSSGYSLTSEHDVRQTELAGKHQGLGEVAKTALEGAASGATFGLSDLAAAKLGGDETRQAMAERKELYPTLRTGSEIAGAIAPVLLSGGSGAAADVAGVAPTSLVAHLGEGVAGATRGLVGEGATSLAGRVAQRAIPMAAQGAAEGAFYGAGQTISESALGDEQLTAEKLLAGAKGGALAGLLGGAAIGTAAEVGKYATEKAFKIAGESGLQDFFKSAADNQTIRALGANARDVRNMGGITKSAEKMEERVADIAGEVRGFKFRDGERLFTGTSTTDQLAEMLPKAKAEVGAELGQLRDKVYEHLGANPELEFNASEFASKVRSEIVEPLKATGIPELEGRAGKLQSSLKRFFGEASADAEHAASGVANDVAPKMSLKDAVEFRKNLDDLLYPKSKSGIVIPPEHQAQLLQARGMLEDAITQTTDNAVAAMGDKAMTGRYQALKTSYRNLGDAERIATDANGRALARNTVGLSDKMAGASGFVGTLAAGAGGIPALGASLAGGVANHLANTYGNSVAAKSFERLAGLSHAVADVDTKLSAGVKALLEGAKSAAVKSAVEAPMLNPAAKVATTPKERYEQVASRVANAAANPASLANHTAGAIGQVAQSAPNVAQAMGATIQKAVQVVQSKLPTPPSSNATLVPRITQAPNDSDRAKLLRAVRGVDPAQTIADIKAGRLSSDQVEVMKGVMPKLYAEKQGELLEKYADLVSKGKNISYEQQIQLGKFLGAPVTPTMAPRFISTVQAMYAKRKQGAGGQPQGAPKRQIDIAGAFATGSQKLGGL